MNKRVTLGGRMFISDSLSRPEQRGNTFLRQLYPISGILLNILTSGCIIAWPTIVSDPHVSYNLSTKDVSLIACITGLGMLNGNLFVPFLLQSCSRNLANTLASLPTFLSGLIIYFGKDFQVLLLGRFIQGLLIGMQAPVVTISIGEYASVKYRGTFLASISTSIALGMLFCHAIGLYLLPSRETNLVCMSFAVVSIFIFFTSPDTPPNLAYKQKIVECKECFRWLRGYRDEKELEIMIKKYERQTEQTFESWCVRYYKLAKKTEFYKPILCISVLFVMSQSSGANVIPNYGLNILKSISGNAVKPYARLIITDSIRVVATVTSLFTIYYFKVRTVFFYSCGFSFVSTLFTAVYLHLRDLGYSEFKNAYLPMIAFMAYTFFMASSIHVIPLMLMGELFSMEIKPLGGLACSFILGLVVAVSVNIGYYQLENTALYVTFYMFSAVLAIFVPILWYIIPETKGKTLIDLENLYTVQNPSSSTAEDFNVVYTRELI